MRTQLLAELLGLRLLPREVRRRVEELPTALVVVARAAHELVEDVVAVDAAAQERPTERGHEVEDVVRLVASLPRDAKALCGRRRSLRRRRSPRRSRGGRITHTGHRRSIRSRPRPFPSVSTSRAAEGDAGGPTAEQGSVADGDGGALRGRERRDDGEAEADPSAAAAARARRASEPVEGAREQLLGETRDRRRRPSPSGHRRRDRRRRERAPRRRRCAATRSASRSSAGSPASARAGRDRRAR